MRGLSTIPRGEARGRCAAPARGRAVAPRRVEVELGPQSEERIALRVAELLGGRRSAKEPDLITAGELARKLRVERPWVYRRWRELGGIRLDDGPRAPLRFDPVEARSRFRQMRGAEGGRS